MAWTFHFTSPSTSKFHNVSNRFYGTGLPLSSSFPLELGSFKLEEVLEVILSFIPLNISPARSDGQYCVSQVLKVWKWHRFSGQPVLEGNLFMLKMIFLTSEWISCAAAGAHCLLPYQCAPHKRVWLMLLSWGEQNHLPWPSLHGPWQNQVRLLLFKYQMLLPPHCPGDSLLVLLQFVSELLELRNFRDDTVPQLWNSQVWNTREEQLLLTCWLYSC